MSLPKISPDDRPSDYEYALLSQHVYEGSKLKKEVCLPNNDKWVILEVKENKESGYFGAIYINDETKQIVLAHRGTDSFKAFLEDIWGIYLNKNTPQKIEAFVFVGKAIELANAKNYHLSFTGHSLGAFLAELSVFYAKREIFLDVNAVTFESPGSKDCMEKMQPNLGCIDLEKLDIITYLSTPNLVNTLYKHVGTVYHIKSDSEISGLKGAIVRLTSNILRLVRRPYAERIKTLGKHSIKEIIPLLEGSNISKRHCMSDWPLGPQAEIYLKYTYAELPEEERKKIDKVIFSLNYEAHYQEEHSVLHILALRHFSSSMQKFLTNFDTEGSKIARDKNKSERLRDKWLKMIKDKEIIDCLLNFQIEEDGSNIKKIVLKDGVNAHDFRRELSKKLHESHYSIEQFFNLSEKPDEDSQPKRDLNAVIAADNATLKDSAIENIGVSTNSENLNEGAQSTKKVMKEVLSVPKMDLSINAPNTNLDNSSIRNISFTCDNKGTNSRRPDS